MTQPAHNELIEPKPAPLSHLSGAREHSRGLDLRVVAVVVLVVAVALGLTVWAPWDVQTSAPEPLSLPASPTGNAANQPAASQTTAPFATTQRTLARQQAQESLAAFVESQLLLENTMAVDTWGQQELSAALQLAKQGDIAFTEQKFAAALQAYADANTRLQEVIAMGEQRFDQQLTRATNALAKLDHKPAKTAIDNALLIKPNDANALAIAERISHIPQIVTLLRDAQNHILAERYAEALKTYAAVRQLGPATPELDERVNQVRERITQAQIAQHISSGFDHLRQRQFNTARRSFNAALKLDPDNAIAAGGLAQVAQDNDIAQIQGLRSTAQTAMQAEQWADAIDAYNAILALDANIQFAVSGLNEAKAHQRAERLLQTIVDSPGKLSTQALFLDAQEILAQAGNLQHRGPRLTALASTTAQLLETYRNPVEVTFLSDNATDIVVSNLGRLGFFDRKVVTVRPGEYTIRGSQDGCRDLYLTIEILPGIEPLDLSCPEPLNR